MKQTLRLNLYRATNGACMQLEGPCERVLCRYHLSEVHGRKKSRPVECVEPCSLKLAEERGGMTLEEIGANLGIVRERVRQVERKALESLGKKMKSLGAADVLDFLSVGGRTLH